VIRFGREGKENGTLQEKVLIGRGREIVAVPRPEWEQAIAGKVPLIKDRLSFMSPDHHRVRNFVVRELPRKSEPISPKWIGGSLDLPFERVNSLLGDLERNLTFLYRNEKGEVSWAYPVTVDQTPHQATFSSGEKLHAA
jgi:hypothetical protein